MPTCFICDCGATKSNIAYKNRFWPEHPMLAGLAIYTCKACGVSFAPTEASESEISDFYRNHYRSSGSPYALDFHSREIGRRINPRSFAQISLALAFSDFQPGDTFLDIGAGDGSSFVAANTLLPTANLMIVEKNSDSILALRSRFPGLKVATSDCPEAESVKVILSSHSLEHLRPRDVIGALEEIRRQLAPGGTAVIEVPNVDFRNPDFLDRYTAAPHFVFFTETAFRLALEKAGFRIVYLRSVGQLVPRRIRDRSVQERIRQKLGRMMTTLVSKILSRPARMDARTFVSDPTFLAWGQRDCIRAAVQRAI